MLDIVMTTWYTDDMDKTIYIRIGRELYEMICIIGRIHGHVKPAGETDVSSTARWLLTRAIDAEIEQQQDNNNEEPSQ